MLPQRFEQHIPFVRSFSHSSVLGDMTDVLPGSGRKYLELDLVNRNNVVVTT